MQYPDQRNHLRIQLDTKHCLVPPEEWDKMLVCLSPLEKVVQNFPVSDLLISINRHPRSKDYHVKTSLILTGKTVFTGDRDVLIYPAYERCVRKLIAKVQSYKDSLGESSEVSKHEKGTHQELRPTRDPNPDELNRALEALDYRAFRSALFPYEEPVRKHLGRWVERYPEIEGQIGQGFTLTDMVEEVFLNAFEQYDQRPKEIRLGDWLESLIDPSIKALWLHPDEEKENIRFAQTMTETPTE